MPDPAVKADARPGAFARARVGDYLTRYALANPNEVVHTMTNVLLGIIAGLVFGGASVAMMLPMSFPDKSAALSAAFADRFAIGVVIACVQLPWPGWVTGLTFGLLLSLPSAIITKAYAPILMVGALGGLIIGGVIHGWLPRA